jgi:hypothetical protein
VIELAIIEGLVTALAAGVSDAVYWYRRAKQRTPRHLPDLREEYSTGVRRQRTRVTFTGWN